MGHRDGHPRGVGRRGREGHFGRIAVQHDPVEPGVGPRALRVNLVGAGAGDAAKNARDRHGRIEELFGVGHVKKIQAGAHRRFTAHVDQHQRRQVVGGQRMRQLDQSRGVQTAAVEGGRMCPSGQIVAPVAQGFLRGAEEHGERRHEQAVPCQLGARLRPHRGEGGCRCRDERPLGAALSRDRDEAGQVGRKKVAALHGVIAERGVEEELVAEQQDRLPHGLFAVAADRARLTAPVGGVQIAHGGVADDRHQRVVSRLREERVRLADRKLPVDHVRRITETHHAREPCEVEGLRVVVAVHVK